MYVSRVLLGGVVVIRNIATVSVRRISPSSNFNRTGEETPGDTENKQCILMLYCLSIRSSVSRETLERGVMPSLLLRSIKRDTSCCFSVHVYCSSCCLSKETGRDNSLLAGTKRRYMGRPSRRLLLFVPSFVLQQERPILLLLS